MKPGERKRCDACGRDVIGAVHWKTGKVAPIVLESTEGGNCMLFQAETPEGPDPTELRYMIPSRTIVGELRDAGVPLRLNHFADCPEAARFHRSVPS